MLIVIIIWLTIAMAGLGVLPHMVDTLTTHQRVITQPCDCDTDMNCMERCGGYGDPEPIR